ncbi:MAG TPA: HPF/RaiA family ribosome-associated protein [Candidatus Paceibacterota bacterium]|nr:HPF/RaiA family ribosome-associated protein [Candidatus Paceibacterota bacterium]
MHITIKATRHQLNDEERTLVNKKLGSVEKLLGRDGETAELNVEIAVTAEGEKHGEACRTEVNLTAGGKFYRASASADTMNSAIEAVHRELAREVKSERGRARTLWKRGRAAIKAMLRS